MSFFDLIENDQIQPPDSVTTTWNSRENMPDPVTIPAKPPARSPARSPAKAVKKPERLKFLKPCPICRGREFTHGKAGGFYCKVCQPGIAGLPVIALGNRQPPETATGLPCAGCGSTTYTKIENGYIFDDGTLVNGWHCGRENCHIKLLIGNKKADRKTKARALKKPPGEGQQQPKNRF